MPPSAQVRHISTSFPGLDQALGMGGIPRGHLTEICGTPASGTTTLALKAISQAQTMADTAAYIDLGGTFDRIMRPDVRFDWLGCCWYGPLPALRLLRSFRPWLASGGVGVLVFAAGHHLLTELFSIQTLTTAFRRRLPKLAQSPCALIFLTSLPLGSNLSATNNLLDSVLSPYTTMYLWLKKEHWLHQPAHRLNWTKSQPDSGSRTSVKLASPGAPRPLQLPYIYASAQPENMHLGSVTNAPCSIIFMLSAFGRDKWAFITMLILKAMNC